MATDNPTAPDRLIWDIWLSMHWMPSLAVADELGIFDALAVEPATAEALAARMTYDARAMRAVLRMLAALRVLTVRGGTFELSEEARAYLVKTSPYYMGPLLAIGGASPWHAKIAAALTTVSPELARPGGFDHWERGQIDPETARPVARVMHCHSLPAALRLASALDLAGVRRLLDVGGGSGCYSIAFAQRYPQLACTIMDLPGMNQIAREYIAAGGASDRVDTCDVDMFRHPWPTGYDAVFMSNVLHDWPFDKCRELALRAHAVLPVGGHILVHEMLLDDDGVGPTTTVSFSLLMLTGTRGQQLTFRELAELLEAAGFVEVRVRENGYFSLVSARKR